VPVVQAAIGIIEPMQMLNQQVATVWRCANQCAHLLHRQIVCLTTFEFAFATNALTHVVHRAKGHGFDV